MGMSPTERTAQLRQERRHLSKADTDIEEGLLRIRYQEIRVQELQSGGYDSRQAERLVELLKQTLVEWERHRTLILQRLNHLENVA
ncbi:hypothetical protein IVB18_35960 [Bradyrhizobium sp. 186]|uniref:hypothetical protein n=1 Tax=Bradyrhizobium sp. 186 TaxID=2782654 RepID=UPI002001C221|nr:hypothetical protein [Bradyrhizobium sp. 186]UPK40569.1 hypothetical protein IVB18_35960 [Bradyrhizobium sp. 186]